MSLLVKVQWKGRNLPKAWKGFADSLDPYMNVAHRKCAMSIVADAVAWSRVDTGRMRAGWLPYLLDNNYPYQSLLGTNSKDYEGSNVTDGTYTEEPMHTILENNVVYTEFVEDKVGVFDMEGKSAYRSAPIETLEEGSEIWANKYGMRMQQLLDNACSAWNKKEDVGEPDDSGFPAPGGME